MNRTLLALLVLAACLRIAMLPLQTVIESDGVDYALVAENLAAGDGLLPGGDLHFLLWPPGYPALIAAVYPLLGDSEMAGRLVSLGAGVLLVFLTWVIGRRLFGPVAATAGSLLVATSPALIVWDVKVLSESTYMAIAGLCLLLACRVAARPTATNGTLLGLSLGALYLTRPEGFVIGVALLLWLSIWLGWRQRRAALRACCPAVAGFLVCLLPYIVYMHSVTGKWQLSGKTQNNLYVSLQTDLSDYEALQFGLNDDMEAIGTYRFGELSLTDLIRSDPLSFVSKYASNLYREALVLGGEGGGILLFLAALGALVLWSDPGRRYAAPPIVCFLLPLAVYPLFYIQDRNVASAIPIFCLLAGGAFSFIDRQAAGFPAFGRTARMTYLMLSVTTAIVMLPYFYQLKRIAYLEPHENKEAGLWLRGKAQTGGGVLSRKSFVAYYSGLPHVAMPEAPVERILAYGHSKNVEFVVIDERVATSRRPQILHLLDVTNAPPFLEPILVIHREQGRKLVLYRFDHGLYEELDPPEDPGLS
jgi:4-amino-4-deoxy-L-arabinose transferase-like glycosyltransferase